MFKGRKLLIATKHEKEKVIAPILEKELGVYCFTSLTFDTDEFGTFTGEIERKRDPLTTVREKCLLAMELNKCDLAVASEGSFGPHPSVGFVSADDEILIFIDKKNELEVVARELSFETNFNGTEVKTKKELHDFIEKAKFPTHALIIKKDQGNSSEIVKGIKSMEELSEKFDYFISTYGKAFVETDMRAMNNPSRMKVIEKATMKLVTKINTFCPHCNTPGFGITEAKHGLPCKICNSPTRSILSYIFSCKKCSFVQENKYPHGFHVEDPTWCDLCNP